MPDAAGEQVSIVDHFSIDKQFCGPPTSGNGGYTCGRLADYIDGRATVRLLKPPPLNVPLEVVRNGDQMELQRGEDVIARAWPCEMNIEAIPAPDRDSARRRAAVFAGFTQHVFETCFVCGTARQEGDGLRIFAGPKLSADEKEHHVACTWTPHRSLCIQQGDVAERFVWAALDCPGGWAFLSYGREVALLGQMSAEIHAPLRCGEEYIVAGWEIDREGRKRHTGSALYNAVGEPVARAQATWITIDPPSQ